MTIFSTPLRLARGLFWAGVLFTCSLEGAEPVLIKGHPAHPTRILAKYRAGVDARAGLAAADQAELRVVERYSGVPGLVLLDTARLQRQGLANPLKAGELLLGKIGMLQRSGQFEFVEPDYLVRASAAAQDLSYANGVLWGLRNTGQNGGTAGADIGAAAAWEISTGSTNVVVAVIDTGIRYTHQELAAQMWRNPREIPDNGRDDEGDGYVDNVFGINSVTGSGDPMDDNDHGTHVAGTIGAAANDGNPHVGVAWKVQLMACKFLDEEGNGSTADAIKCINFAVRNGAKILNNSWGGGGFSQGLYESIAAARDAGVLFVAAAGNESSDNDEFPAYPASYDLENVVSVAAHDRADKLASFSNFGSRSVHLAAPGEAIYSSTSGSDSEYQDFGGTSMATPHVTGVAALLLARFPDLSVRELRERLLGTTVAADAFRGMVFTGGRVNAHQALTSTPDGRLELLVSASSGRFAPAGETVSFYVHVTDLFSVTNATVVGTLNGAPLLFLNDGMDPDVTADDGRYTASAVVPTVGTDLVLAVSATAPGKEKATNVLTMPILFPPANDAWADRIALGSVDKATSGSNLGAHKELGEPNHGGNSGGKSVWWSWTPLEDSYVSLSTEHSTFDTLLAVYIGNSVSNLVLVAENDDVGTDTTSRISFNARAGESYGVAVDGYDGAAGDIFLQFTLAPPTVPEANDLFSNRTLLSGTNATGSGINISASREPGEPNHAGNLAAKSLWWSWAAPGSGRATIKTDGSTFDTVLGVYTGAALGSLSPVASDDDSGAGTASLVRFNTSAGTVYQVAVDGFDGLSGEIQLSISFEPVSDTPVNDSFAVAAPLSGVNVTASGSNRGATKEVGEPAHAGNSGGRSVWWIWTAPGTGPVSVSTEGSSFDTLLAVYTGASLVTLTEVASNDQDPSGANTSRLSFGGAGGTVYFIAVDGQNGGFGAEAGDIVLRIDSHPDLAAPPNDDFAARAEIPAGTVQVSGSNFGASQEAGEPEHAGASGGHSVWWKWRSMTNQLVSLSTQGSGFDTILAVYTGADVAQLAVVASNDDAEGRTSRVNFTAEAGVEFQIAVDGYDAAEMGTIVLQISADAVTGPLPENNDFDERLPLTGTVVFAEGSNRYATSEAGEPWHANRYGGKSVWWSWTAWEAGVVEVTTLGSTFDTVLAVYRGAVLNNLTAVSSNDDSLDRTSRVVFNAEAGVEYAIAVDGYGGETGGIRLAVRWSMRADPVANDLFAGRIQLSGSQVSARASNAAASKEAGEPDHAGNPGGRSLWWQWEAPENGRAAITTAGSDFDTVVAVYTGSGLADLFEVGSDDDTGDQTSAVIFSAQAGTVYLIAVDGYNGSYGEIALEVSVGPEGAAPPNDAFAQRLVISALGGSVLGSNLDASQEPGEPDHADELGGRSVWWSWTPVVSGHVVISTAGSNFDTLLGVYTGEAIEGLLEVAANDDAVDVESEVEFEAVAGQTYQVAVDGYDGAEGDVRLTVILALNNDDFAAAVAVAGSSWSVVGANDFATKEPAEGDHAGNPGGHSVWWKWTAPADMVVSVRTDGSSFDTLLAIYTGDALDALQEVVFDDDNGAGSASLAVFAAIAGRTYQIAVDGFDGVTGDIALELRPQTPVPNDLFDSRVGIEGNQLTITASNAAATREFEEPNHAGNRGGASLWWTWTAPSAGRLQISTRNSSFDTILAVYTGSALAGLNLVAANDDIDSQIKASEVSLLATAGTAYSIAVDGFSGSRGSVQLALTFEPQGVEAPRIIAYGRAAGGFQVSVASVAGQRYTLEFTGDIEGGAWTEVAAVDGDGSSMTLVDGTAAGSIRFYRVKRTTR